MEDKIKDIDKALNSLKRDEEQLKKELNKFYGKYEIENGKLTEPREVTEYKRELEKIRAEINRKTLEKRQYNLLKEKEKLSDVRKNLQNMYRGQKNADEMIEGIVEKRKNDIDAKLSEIEKSLQKLRKIEEKDIDIETLLKNMEERAKKEANRKEQQSEKLREKVKPKETEEPIDFQEDVEEKKKKEEEEKKKKEEEEKKRKEEEEKKRKEEEEKKRKEEEEKKRKEEEEKKRKEEEEKKRKEKEVKKFIESLDQYIKEIENSTEKPTLFTKRYGAIYEKFKNYDGTELELIDDTSYEIEAEVSKLVKELNESKQKLEEIKSVVPEDFRKAQKMYVTSFNKKNNDEKIKSCSDKIEKLEKIWNAAKEHLINIQNIEQEYLNIGNEKREELIERETEYKEMLNDCSFDEEMKIRRKVSRIEYILLKLENIDIVKFYEKKDEIIYGLDEKISLDEKFKIMEKELEQYIETQKEEMEEKIAQLIDNIDKPNGEVENNGTGEIVAHPKKNRIKATFSNISRKVKKLGNIFKKGGKKTSGNSIFKGIYNLLDKLADRIAPLEPQESKEKQKKDSLEEQIKAGDDEYNERVAEEKVVDINKSKEYRRKQRVSKDEVKPVEYKKKDSDDKESQQDNDDPNRD